MTLTKNDERQKARIPFNRTTLPSGVVLAFYLLLESVSQKGSRMSLFGIREWSRMDTPLSEQKIESKQYAIRQHSVVLLESEYFLT